MSIILIIAIIIGVIFFDERDSRNKKQAAAQPASNTEWKPQYWR